MADVDTGSAVRVEIPRHVGGPPQFFFWELDEVIVFSFCMVVGLATRQLTWMLLIGLVITRLFSGWKANKLPGVLAHMAYWYGLSSLNKIFERGDSREFVE
jgi:conjugal transfer pilus assembly protein TraL